jgi:hypothetical protein
VVQLSPPLIADTEQFQEIGEVLHDVLSEAWNQIDHGPTRDPVRAAPRAG